MCEKQYKELGRAMIINHFIFKDKELRYFVVDQLSHL